MQSPGSKSAACARPRDRTRRDQPRWQEARKLVTASNRTNGNLIGFTATSDVEKRLRVFQRKTCDRPSSYRDGSGVVCVIWGYRSGVRSLHGIMRSSRSSCPSQRLVDACDFVMSLVLRACRDTSCVSRCRPRGDLPIWQVLGPTA